MDKRPTVAAVIETLRQQRVRQGDLIPVLDRVIAQAALLRNGRPVSAAISDIADDMASRARQLKWSARSLPKFVVEELVEEFISKLERAA